MSYHPNNLKLQPYDHDKVIKLAEMAEGLGIQFKIAGIPFGADYDESLWKEFFARSNNCAVADHRAGALGAKA
jgi:hypothetical protein